MRQNLFKVFFFFFLLMAGLSVGILSCNGSTEDDATNYVIPDFSDTAGKSEPFYPYISYLQDQLLKIDTIPYAIEKITAINGMTIDSGYTTKEVLKAAATGFLEIDPSSPSIKMDYSENSFQDLTLGRITFSLTARKKDLPLQQVDILLNPENNKVKNIVLKKYLNQSDSSVSQNLLWVNDRYLQISETIQKKDGTLYDRVIKIIWDRPLE